MAAIDDLKTAVTASVDASTAATAEMNAVATELAAMTASTVTDAQLADLASRLTGASTTLSTASDSLKAADAAHNAPPATPTP